MPIGFHAIVTLQVTDLVVLVKNFGGNWYQSNLEQNFVQFVRQRGMNETAIDTPALDGHRCGNSRKSGQVQRRETAAGETGQRKAAEEARAAADNAYWQAIGLSPEYVQLKKIEMQRDVRARDKCAFIDNGGAVPTLQVT